jgi:hypothetical protein
MVEDFEHFLRAAFPENTDAAVVRAIREAVALADDVRRNTPWLMTEVGYDIVGTLRRAAAMWHFEQSCIAGVLPFEAKEIPNSTGSSHLLRVRSGKFDAHVLRTESAGAFPKDAPIRQDSRLTNTSDLFDPPSATTIKELMEEVSRSYAWLLFNATEIGALTHVCWGMPHAEEDTFLAHFNILRRVLSLGLDETIDATGPAKPDPSQKVKFKDHLDESIERARAGKSKTG